MRSRSCAVLAVAIAAAIPGEAGAKWTEGILLLPSLHAKVDGKPVPAGPLAGKEIIESGAAEARIFVRGPDGQALVVMAPGTSVTLSGSVQAGLALDLASGAVKIVAKGSKGKPPVAVTSAGEAVGIGDPGGVVSKAAGKEPAIIALGSPEAIEMFPEDAPAQAKGMGMPAPGLPLVGAAKGHAGEGSGSQAGGGAEVEGGSKCIDSSSAGPEGANPGGDGTDPTQIDRTQTRVDVRVTW